MTTPDEPSGPSEKDPSGPSDDAASGALGDASMRAAVVSVLISGLCLAVGALGFFGVRSGLGVLLGGLLATANLAVFARIGQAFLSQRGHAAPWGVIAVIKLGALFGAVWLILRSEIVSGLALAVGYGALPIGITIGSLFGPKPPENFPDTTPRAKSGRDVINAGPRSSRKD